MLQPWEHAGHHEVLYHSSQHCTHATPLLASALPFHHSQPCGKKLKSMEVPSPWEPSSSPTQLPSPKQQMTRRRTIYSVPPSPKCISPELAVC